jgi:hypothetical protein
MGSKKGRTSGRFARPVAASYRDKASSSSSPIEALLVSMLLQRLLLLGLADLALLGGVLRLFLLGRQEASSVPSDLVFQKWRSCFLHRRQVMYTDLD